MKKLTITLLAAVLMILEASAANATIVTARSTLLAGNSYELEFTLFNNGFTDPTILPDQIQWFRVDFNPIDSYSNIQPGSTPANWFSYTFQPDSANQLPGSYNADTVVIDPQTGLPATDNNGNFLVNDGIFFLDSLGGFKATFDQQGLLDLSLLTFEVGNFTPIDDPDTGLRSYDPFSPITLDVGNVTPAPVPEPTTLFLLGAGLGCIALFRRRQQ